MATLADLQASVQKATYYQFHKGAYFDSTLTLLSAWPRASLPQLSIVQDPLSSSIAPTKQFAQPLVFFRLDSLCTLAASPYLSTVTSVRLRIPTRQVSSHLHRYERSFPRLHLLDISTCHTSESEVAALLVDLPSVQSLILDECPVVTQRADAFEAAGAEALGQWNALGKALASVGVKRSRLKEKMLKTWFDQQKQAAEVGSSFGQSTSAQRVRAGRRGVATATISLRNTDEDVNPAGLKPSAPLPPQKKGQNTKRKQQSGSIAEPSARAAKPTTSSLGTLPPARLPATQPASLRTSNIRILASPPSLRSLACTAPMASVSSDDFKEKYEVIRKEFEAGWASGVKVMLEVRGRVKTSWYNGIVKVMMDDNMQQEEEDEGAGTGRDSDMDTTSAASGSDSSSSGSSSSLPTNSRARRRDGDAQLQKLLSGLREPNTAEEFELDPNTVECPVLCLAGSHKNDFHPVGCPHELAWKLWGDDS